MVLSLLAWHFDTAGAWILAAGVMRYAFVLAGVRLIWLRAKHVRSANRWRKTECISTLSPLFVVWARCCF